MLAFVVKAGCVWLCVVLTETIWATTVSTCQDVQQMSSSESTQLLRELQWRQVFTSQTKYLFQHIVEHQHTKSPSPTHTPALQPLLSLSLHSSSSPWLIFSLVIFNSYRRGNICFIIFLCLLPTGASRPKIWTSRYSIQNCHSKMVPDMWHWSLSAEE